MRVTQYYHKKKFPTFRIAFCRVPSQLVSVRDRGVVVCLFFLSFFFSPAFVQRIDSRSMRVGTEENTRTEDLLNLPMHSPPP